jgi:hypothetical protein
LVRAWPTEISSRRAPAKKELASKETVPLDGDDEDTGQDFQNAFPEDIPF